MEIIEMYHDLSQPIVGECVPSTTTATKPELCQVETCRKCGGMMKRGIAIEQTWVSGLGDFIGDRHGITLSPGGSGGLVNCLKCEKCGHSIA